MQRKPPIKPKPRRKTPPRRPRVEGGTSSNFYVNRPTKKPTK